MDRPGVFFRFGAYESRPSSRELYKHGIRLRIRPQPLQILNLLLSQPGEVVTREEIRAKLWSAETFVDFEHSLNTAVKELRAALGDSASEPRYIETLPRLGYRFVASVETLGTVDDAASLEAAAPGKAASARAVSGDVLNSGVPSGKLARLRWQPWLKLGFATVLIASVALFLMRARFGAHHEAAAGRAMLAVLPFENLTGDAGQEYFSDGLTEEMITQLGRLDPQHLGVIARTSVMQLKQTREPLPRVGSELGVQYVLEGSVRKDSNQIRVAAQLIRVADQTHLWAREYDRDLSSLLAVQGEIAQEIADEIELLLGNSQTRPVVRRTPVPASTSYEAYDFYLRGRYFLNQRSEQGFREAADYFQKAIAKDPKYAPAYAGLADTFALMSTWRLGPASEFMPKARAAALKALELDDTLADAHTSLALIAESYDYDWQTAEKEYRRAIQLDPGYPTAHQWYAECLSFEGRFDEAFAESERARQLDPLSLIIATDHGALLYFARQYDRSIEQFRAVLDMDPGFSRAHMILDAYVQAHKFDDAIAQIDAWAKSDTVFIESERAYVYGHWGRKAQAREALLKLKALLRQNSEVDPIPILLSTYAAMDEREEAIALLQKAYANRSNTLLSLKVEPNYDGLRNDPRFVGLLHRVGLAQ